MRTLAEGTERREAMGARGAAVAAERFAWGAVAEQMESVYESVVGAGGRGGASLRPPAAESDLVAS
jgi:hypothetical protein